MLEVWGPSVGIDEDDGLGVEFRDAQLGSDLLVSQTDGVGWLFTDSRGGLSVFTAFVNLFSEGTSMTGRDGTEHMGNGKPHVGLKGGPLDNCMSINWGAAPDIRMNFDCCTISLCW